MEKKIEKLMKLYEQFSSYSMEEKKDIITDLKLAMKIVNLYDRIDSYLLTEDEDEKVYRAYDSARTMLYGYGVLEEPEMIPMNFK